MHPMAKRDYNRQDQFYQKAKAAGYRSRAAYKLIELDSAYHLFRAGMRVVDLGGWPGGWVQVARERVGEKGRIVAIDLVEIEPFGDPHTMTIQGDAADEQVLSETLLFLGGKADIVLSDMSPKLTGIREADIAGTAHCAELSFYLCGQLLAKGGSLVVKVFPSPDVDSLVAKGLRRSFQKVKRTSLDATRRSSDETYVICQGFSGEIPS